MQHNEDYVIAAVFGGYFYIINRMFSIHYKASRTHGGRKISFWRENVAEDVSMCDDRDNLFENGGDV